MKTVSQQQKLRDKAKQLQSELLAVKENLKEMFDYRTELIEDVLVTEKAAWLVKELFALEDLLKRQTKEAVACVQFDVDDGPEDYQTLESLWDLSYLAVLHCGACEVTQMTAESSPQTGHYVLISL